MASYRCDRVLNRAVNLLLPKETMNQRQFQAEEGGQSQAEIILQVLAAKRGKWVGMPTLWRASGAMAVHSRVADLRKKGFQIDNHTINRHRKKHSFYRLQA